MSSFAVSVANRQVDSDLAKRRRHTTVGNKETQEQIVSKNAFVFLCLFDGFRMPTIRRLTRKPRTICFEPLINYNPRLSSPAQKNSINGRYESLLHISSDNVFSIIDPSTNEVSSAVSRSLSRPTNERIIIHYFGQGSIPPSKSGQIFFFDSQHSTYKGMSIANVIGTASKAPIALILDVNSAGALQTELFKLVEEKNINLIAFMSCDDGETLPLAPSLPFDVLSSAILFPVETTLWFHLHSTSQNYFSFPNTNSGLNSNANINSNSNSFSNNNNNSSSNNIDMDINVNNYNFGNNINSQNSFANFSNSFVNSQNSFVSFSNSFVNSQNLFVNFSNSSSSFSNIFNNNPLNNFVSGNNSDGNSVRIENGFANDNINNINNNNNNNNNNNRGNYYGVNYNGVCSNIRGNDNNIKEIIENLSKSSSFHSFLNSVIESIAFSKLDQSTYEKFFFNDSSSSIAVITRGFILAQRILKFHNIHSKAIPILPDFTDSELWGYLDLALDMVFTQGLNVVPVMPDVFEQLVISFKNFPIFEVLPIFCHFLTVPFYYERIQMIMFNYIDVHYSEIPVSLNTIVVRSLLNNNYYGFNNNNTNNNDENNSLLCNVSNSFCDISQIIFLTISKLVFFNPLNIDDMKLLISKINPLKTDTIGSALLATTCCINKTSLVSSQTTLLLDLCDKYSLTAAPYAQILFGFIVMKAISFEMDERFLESFEPLLKSAREDVRAATIFAISYAKDVRSLNYLIDQLYDDSELVQFETLVALTAVINSYDHMNKSNHHLLFVPIKKKEKDNNMDNDNLDKDNKIIDKNELFDRLEKALAFAMKKGESEMVRGAAEDLLPFFEDFIKRVKDENEKDDKKNDDIETETKSGGNVGFGSFSIGKIVRPKRSITSRIPEKVRKSITSPGLLKRFMTDMFDAQ